MPMLTNIDINIRINDETMEVHDVKIGIDVGSNLSLEAMDYVLASTFDSLAKRIYEKISLKLNNKQPN
jgi:hypothetical protein